MFTFTTDWAMVIQVLIIPVVFPTLVGLVSNSKWTTLAKRLTLGGFVLVGNFLTALAGSLTNGSVINVSDLVIQWLLSWGVAELMYWKLYQAPVTPPVAVETPVEKPSVDPNAHSKAELMSLVESVTGQLPDSKLTKPELAAIVTDHTVQASEITVIPGTTIADWLRDHGNRAG